MSSAGRSFLWAAHYCSALATYPEVLRAEPARRCQPKLADVLPYLVLLRVGFAMPSASLRRRCALTAPFHPYRNLAVTAVCFLWHWPSTVLEHSFPDVIRHTALRSSDFPPAAPPKRLRATVRSGCQPCNYSLHNGSFDVHFSARLIHARYLRTALPGCPGMFPHKVHQYRPS